MLIILEDIMNVFMCYEQRGLVRCGAGCTCYSDCKAWDAKVLIRARSDEHYDQMESRYRDMAVSPVPHTESQLIDLVMK